MARELTGKPVADHLDQLTRERIAALLGRDIHPTLSIVRVGEDPGDLSYERGAIKRCEALGIEVRREMFPEEVTQEKLLSAIRRINQDREVHGVLMLRPLPRHIDQAKVENALDAGKDVDGMTDLSMSGVFTAKEVGFAPCTAQACMELLNHYGIDCTGKKAVVLGRSLVIGKPAAMMLLQRNATVTICHTRTQDLPETVRQADLVIAAAGRARMVNEHFLRPGQVVLDVGINVDENGRLCGDVDAKAADGIVDALTPVPRGIGSVTTSVLARHVVEAAERSLRGEGTL